MFVDCTFLNSPFKINSWNTSSVTNMSGMFKNCLLFNQSIGSLNTANVANMSSMFENARTFNLNIGNWNTSSVTDMSGMFKDASSFNRNINNWNTSNVTDMSSMFDLDVFSTSELFVFNQPINSWNTSSVINMSRMFYGNSLFNQNISNWNTSNVTDMAFMFSGAISFNQNIGNWNVSNVTNMTSMFDLGLSSSQYSSTTFNNGGSSSLQNWNTINVTNMSGMFRGAGNFNHSFANLKLNPIVNLTDMLDNSGLDCTNYSQTLIAWNANPNTPNNRILGAAQVEYGPQAVAAINNLTQNKGWGFSGHDIFTVNPTFTIPTNYCSGATIPALPNISENGVSGSWQPAINNTQTTTYFFIPNVGECGVATSVTITINPNVIPTFSVQNSYCNGATIPALPITSTNGVSGTWSPAINNTQTTTYTFTPNAGQCGTSTTLTISINGFSAPTFSIPTNYCSGQTIPALPTTSINGITGTWSPALDNLQTTTYTFTPTSGACDLPTTITININSIVTPTFILQSSYCGGSSIPALPTKSNNGISGTWTPVINPNQTTVYTFTPNVGQCASTFSQTINIIPQITPTFGFQTSFCSGANVPNLPLTSTNGVSGSWLPSVINNIQSATYTFVPFAGQCAPITNVSVTINQATIPTFTIQNNYCAGQTIPALPTTSSNGIAGTWSPALNQNQTTNYTFTPNAGQCAVGSSVTITINPQVTPTFTIQNSYCAGQTIPALPTTSSNGIAGTWSPALNQNQTTNYTFTPNVGQCAVGSSVTISVTDVVAPSGNSQQNFTTNGTLDTIVINPTNVIWYASSTDAISNINAIDNTAALVNNTTYYAVNVNGSCRSLPFPVTVSLTLGLSTIDVFGLKFYPNPVTSSLQIEYKNNINSVEIYNLLGQKLLDTNPEAMQVKIDFNDLPSALYVVRIKSANEKRNKK